MPKTIMLDKISFSTSFKLTKYSPYYYTLERKGTNSKNGKEMFLIERIKTGFRKWVYNKRVYL